MVKCKNCDFESEKLIGPVICPNCGHIAMPHTKVVKKSRKAKDEKEEQAEELVELVKLID